MYLYMYLILWQEDEEEESENEEAGEKGKLDVCGLQWLRIQVLKDHLKKQNDLLKLLVIFTMTTVWYNVQASGTWGKFGQNLCLKWDHNTLFATPSKGLNIGMFVGNCFFCRHYLSEFFTGTLTICRCTVCEEFHVLRLVRDHM